MAPTQWLVEEREEALHVHLPCGRRTQVSPVQPVLSQSVRDGATQSAGPAPPCGLQPGSCLHLGAVSAAGGTKSAGSWLAYVFSLLGLWVVKSFFFFP